MVREIIGKKLGMTRLFSPEGNIVPVTVIEAGPCPIIQKKTKEKDGYNALQVGFLPKKPNRVNRPITGHVKKSGRGTFYILKELRMDEVDQYELGQEIAVDIFQPGDLVDVAGTSKGRGFSGVMKRHGFRGAPGSHGTHEYFRHGGSIGAAADPSRTFKGKKMPGHSGNRRVTVQNIEVADVKPQQNLIFLKGAVPGWRNGIITIRQAKKAATSHRPDAPEEKKEEAKRKEAEAEAKVEGKEVVKEEGKKEEVKAEAKAEEEGKEVAEEEAKTEEVKVEAEAEGKEEVEAEAKVEEEGKEVAEEQANTEKVKVEAEAEAKAEEKAKEEPQKEGP